MSRASSRPRRRIASTVPLIFTLGALGVGALAMTAVRTALSREVKELARLRQRIEEVGGEIERLNRDVQTLISPRILEPAARKLGMRLPRTDQIIRASEGKPTP